MTIQQLRCFVAAAKNENIHRAADQLYLSQPAVTHHIHTLEEELGVKLFYRGSKVIHLTEPGRIFFMDVVDILDRLELARERVRKIPENGAVLHVSCETTLQLTGLSEIYREYKKLMPDISVSTLEASGSEGRDLLSEWKTDVAFLPYDGVKGLSGIAYETLFEGYFCCVVPKGHRLSEKDKVTETDLAGENMILIDTAHCPPEMDRIQRRLQHNCQDTRFSYSGSSVYTLPMIEAGIGIAVMPNFVCPSSAEVVTIPFDIDTKIEYGIAWHKDESSQKIKSFIQVTKKVYNSI